MHNVKSRVELKKPYAFFRNEEGAIDLASIMVGVIVIGLIGGVVATTVFAIIPWAQDRAAKQQLDSIVTAQSSYRGLSSDPTLAVAKGHSANSYAASTQLASAGLLAEGNTYCTVGTDEGEGYLAVALSGSGKYWAATDDATKPREISPSEAPESCDFVPYVDKTPTLTVMTYKCETTLEVMAPMRGAVGTATWSDGVTTNINSERIRRTLQAGVEYQLTFDGTYYGMGWGTVVPGDACLISLDHWGSETGVTDASDAFFGARNLVDVPAHIPSTITDMSNMFDGALRINDPDISNWDVSKVENMQSLFSYALAFNQPLNNWDVSSVKYMGFMFSGAATFNQPLNNWDTSTSISMYSMFNAAKAFNSSIEDWDVSQVENMEGMFMGAELFNQPLNKWDTSSVTDTASMFASAKQFDQPLDEWDVSNVETMRTMFSNAQAFNRSLSSWDVSNVTSMSGMFNGTTSLSYGISKWDVSNVRNMSYMFRDSKFNEPLDEWDVSNVTNMSQMFYDSQFNQPLHDWGVLVSNVTNMSEMFYNSQFNQPLNNWNVSKVTNMNQMFFGAPNFNQPLNNWNVSKVTNMSYMFNYANSFNQNLSGWDTAALTNGSVFANTSFPSSFLPPRTSK